jgi:hypothetical protein
MENLRINPDATNSETRLINLYADDRLRATVANLSVEIKGNYSFLTDPPFLADIGEIDISVPSLGGVVDGYTIYSDMNLQAHLNTLYFNAQPLKLQLNGINDMSDLGSKYATTFTNVVNKRLQHFSRNRNALFKANNLINAFSRIIPYEIPIPMTNVTMIGGLESNLVVKKDGYIFAALDIDFNETNRPLKINNTAQFVQEPITKDEVQIYLSQYLVNNVINAGYYFNNSDGKTPWINVGPVDVAKFGLKTSTLNALFMARLSFSFDS